MNPFSRALFVTFASLLIVGCSDDSDSGPVVPAENAGSVCSAAAQCYPSVDAGSLKGAPVCMDKVSGGYCTHSCTDDADCCAVPGECKSSHKQVCSPFESTGAKYCFLSCEDADWNATDAGDANGFCGAFAHAGFSCRSSGGGKENRKVCTP